jgi:hypothetical protein
MAAAAKRRRASPEELREASSRIKQIDAELRALELAPQTKHGEDRASRYERVVRLREMRQEFLSRYPGLSQGGNGLILATMMVILTILACVFFSGGAYFAYSALTYVQPASSAAATYWSSLESQDYKDAYNNSLSANLRTSLQAPHFESDALEADADYGPITSVSLVTPAGQSQNSTATLVYKVTRKKKAANPITYTVTLQMSYSATTGWVINDLGASIYPANDPSVKPVPTTTVTTTTATSG